MRQLERLRRGFAVPEHGKGPPRVLAVGSSSGWQTEAEIVTSINFDTSTIKICANTDLLTSLITLFGGALACAK